jgi:GNAT superfamily N-acetyltransferase
MISFSFEPLDYLLKTGLPELSKECWGNMGDGFYLEVFSPDWRMYKEQEDNKRLGFVAMREDGKLIGYANLIINKDIHQEDLKIAVIHDIFVTKEKRGYASALFHYLEQFALSLGAYRIDVAERLSFDEKRGGAGKFYGFLGYKPMEVIHSKVLVTEGNA